MAIRLSERIQTILGGISYEESGFSMNDATNHHTLGDRIMRFLMKSPDGLPPAHARFFVMSRLGYPLGTMGHLAYVLIFWHLDLTFLSVFNILSVALFASAAVLTNRGNLRLPIVLVILGEVPVHAVLATIYVGPAAGFWIYFFLSSLFVLLAPIFSRGLRLSLNAVLVLALIILAIFTIGAEPLQPIANEWTIFLFISNALLFAAVLVASISSFELAVVRAEEALQVEFERAEMLLLNILPAEIAARLKAKEEPLADSHDGVSVLFADLAGFTDLSRKLSADELVNLLNDLFSRFDDLANRHGAEKIKTIGDAYMAATGLADDGGNHAEAAVDLALGMKEAFEKFREQHNVDLQLRIGVHSGAVIAGVIGTQKFAYDLWGDTVNIASRMESEGLPGQIQISAQTQELLPAHYQSTPRGEIKIKGHMARTTYLLEGRA